MEFSSIFKAPSIPRIRRTTFSSSVFRGAAVKINRSSFSTLNQPPDISSGGSMSIAASLAETNRILVEIQKQLALDFANRIAQEEDQLKTFKVEKEKRQKINKEASIESINKVGKKITNAFGFVTKPVKNIFDSIKQFITAIFEGIVLNNIFTWLEKPENRKRVGEIFQFLADNWKFLAAILIGGVALRALHKVIRLVRAIKGFLRFLRILPPKSGSTATTAASRRGGGLFRTADGQRRGISVQRGVESRPNPSRFTVAGAAVREDVNVIRRAKTPLGRTLQTVETLTAKAGSNILKRIGLGPGAKGVMGLLRPIFKRIPIFGALIDFAVSLALGEPIGRAAAKAVGAALGGALGTLIPIPVGGTVVGGILGDFLGGTLYDAIVGKGKNDNNQSSSGTPQFALGGKIKGPLHSAGGVMINAEGGEYIVKRQQVPKFEPLLQDINENGGRLWDEFVAGVKKQKDINDRSLFVTNQFERLLDKYKEIVKVEEDRMKKRQTERPTGGMGGPVNPNTRISTSNVSNMMSSPASVASLPQQMAPPAPSFQVSNIQPVIRMAQNISMVSFATRDLNPAPGKIDFVTLPPITINSKKDLNSLQLPVYNTGEQEYPVISSFDSSNQYLNVSASRYDIKGLRFG